MFRQFESKSHQIKTVTKRKTTLVPVNTKKYFDDQNNIFSFGHYKIAEIQHNSN